jgi:hypothetical protein
MPSGTSPPPQPDFPPGPFAGIGQACSPLSGTGGGVLSQTQCTVSFGETCGGNDYQATCACPQGTCACFGSSTQVVTFTGCPSCPGPAQVFKACGFPYDPNRM